MAASNRKSKGAAQGGGKGRPNDARRSAAATASRLAWIFAGLAIATLGFYWLSGFEFRGRRDAVVESTPPSSGDQPHSVTRKSHAAIADDVPKPDKTPRRETTSVKQDDPAIDRWFMEAYLRCWSPPAKVPPGGSYAAKIRVRHNADGSLAGPPVLVNPPSDPEWRPYAESAVQAVKKCNPLSVLPDYLPRFEAWRRVTLYFSPDA